MKHAREALLDQAAVDRQWAGLDYLSVPDFERACRESDALAALLESLGVSVEWMPAEDTGMDSIYVRDASTVSDRGAVLCRMAKGARSAEPEAQGRALPELGVSVVGAISGAGTLEGGDATWLSSGTLAVGQGYRTNAEGIAQLGALLGPEVEVLTVPLPHWKGPGDVFHLMSMVSPLADDLVLVYSRLLPVPFRSELLHRGFELVEVPDGEFDSMGCNVLSVAPRVAVALDGNPETCLRMEAVGVEVHTYEGSEISLKGSGGPTCLTRTLERE